MGQEKKANGEASSPTSSERFESEALNPGLEEISGTDYDDEASLLNNRANSGKESSSIKAYEDEWNPEDWKNNYFSELKKLVHLASPATVQAIAQFLQVLTTLITVGQLGTKEELAAAAIGNTWFSVMYSFLIGMSTAFDTLGSQAFGANDKAMVLSWGISASLGLSAACIPLSLGLWYSNWVAAHLFGQDREIAANVASFCRCLIPGLLPFVWGLIITKGMQAQNKMWAPAFITIAAAAVNLPLTIFGMRWLGVIGPAIAISVSRALQLAFFFGYLSFPGTDCISLEKLPGSGMHTVRSLVNLGEFGIELGESESSPLGGRAGSGQEEKGKSLALQTSRGSGWGGDQNSGGGMPGGKEFWTVGELCANSLAPSRPLAFLQLGIPGGFQLSLEAGSFEITTAMASILGTLEVDAHTSLLSLAGILWYTLPYGFGVATAIRTGNLLGAGLPQQARVSGNVTLCAAAVVSALAGLIVFICRNNIGRMFVTDAEVVRLVAEVAPILASFFFQDGVGAVIAGTLRGMGRQTQLMVFNILGYWACGVTLGYVLTFQLGWGLKGIWCGTWFGCLMAAMCNLITYYRVDWVAEARKATGLQAYPEEDSEAVLELQPQDSR